MLKGFVLKNDTKDTLINHINKMDLTATKFTVEIRPFKSKRSIEQNSLSHEWYQILAAQLPDDDALGWKCYCKLHHGVPILRTEDDDFRKVYDEAIKGLDYEKKLQIMKILPVTSIMNTAQLSSYLEAIKTDFMAKGIMLEFPS
ncbi:MAG TPA: hypothetical protein VIC51_15390 [Psychromonas sp.]